MLLQYTLWMPRGLIGAGNSPDATFGVRGFLAIAAIVCDCDSQKSVVPRIELRAIPLPNFSAPISNCTTTRFSAVPITRASEQVAGSAELVFNSAAFRRFPLPEQAEVDGNKEDAIRPPQAMHMRHAIILTLIWQSPRHTNRAVATRLPHLAP